MTVSTCFSRRKHSELNGYIPGRLQHFEARNGGKDFHPVVGDQTKAAAGFGVLLGMNQHRAIKYKLQLCDDGDAQVTGVIRPGQRPSRLPSVRAS